MTRLHIHLIRHGEPACPPKSSLSREEYRCWVEAYDAAGIVDQPPETFRNWLPPAAKCIMFSSSLPRSIQSARVLNRSEQVLSEPMFNEASVAIPSIPFRMSSTAWTLIGRASWLLGASAREDVAACRTRACDAADALVQSAASVETLLVGHGWMNRMIGHELRCRGFNVRQQAKRGYWSRASFDL